MKHLHRHRCGYNNRLRIPYCCIGRFVVTVSNVEASSTKSSLTWTFHGLNSPEMTPELVPRFVAPSSDVNRSRFTINVKIPLQDGVRLIGQWLVSCTLTPHFIDESSRRRVCIVRCSLTGWATCDDNCSNQGSTNRPRSSLCSMELSIEQTHMEWLRFIRNLKRSQCAKSKSALEGTMTFLLSDGSQTERVVWLPIMRQTELPCPPDVVKLEIDLRYHENSKLDTPNLVDNPKTKGCVHGKTSQGLAEETLGSCSVAYIEMQPNG